MKVETSFNNIKSNDFLYIDNKGIINSGFLYFDIKMNIEDSDIKLFADAVNVVASGFTSIYVINGWSQVEFREEYDDKLQTMYVTLKNQNIEISIDEGTVLCIDGNSFEDGIKEVFIKYMTMYLPQFNKDDIISIDISTKFTRPNTLAYFNLPFVNKYGNIAPYSLFFSIEKREDDYDPNCETCRNALKSLASALAMLNGCVFYNKNDVMETTPDYILFKQTSYRYYPTTTKLLTDNCPKFEMNVLPNIYTVGNTIVSNFRDLLNMSKIEKFGLYDSNGAFLLFSVPKADDSVLMFGV